MYSSQASNRRSGDGLGLAAALAIGLGGLGFVTGLNAALNTQTIITPSHTTITRPQGLLGHVELTVFADGSAEVKRYHGFGHRFFASDFYQDLNGDGRVDRIRRNGPEFAMNRHLGVHVREHDYPEHSDLFDRADAEVRRLLEKYPPTTGTASELMDTLR
ncbi:MAG: hypothetical protein ACMXYM_02510 [Candidatus Woesearchaeota archaeon]